MRAERSGKPAPMADTVGVAVMLGFCGVLWGARAAAQGGPPMITDDPGTPGDGRWEINIAALTNLSVPVNTFQLPLIDMNYGVGDRLQLKYEVPYVVEREFGESRSGLGASLLGIKWRFYDAGAAAWQVSTYPQLQFNYPDSASPHRGIAAPGTSVLLPLEFERNVAGFDLTVEVGRWLRPAGQGDSWITGAVIGHELCKGFELLAELHEEGSPGFTRNESILNAGARWDLSERYTVLAAVGRDLHNGFGAQNTLLTYLGIQLHL